MIQSLVPRWTVRTIVLLASLLMFGSTAAAEKTCREVHGKLTSAAVAGPACASPVGLCTAGTTKGGLDSSFEFTATSLTASADTPTTGVVLYTGDIVFHTAGGDLLGKDAGAYNTGAGGDLVELTTLIGGTGSLAGATGTLHVQGTFTAAAGGSSEFTGSLCVP